MATQRHTRERCNSFEKIFKISSQIVFMKIYFLLRLAILWLFGDRVFSLKWILAQKSVH
jgi:hypothetical protein